MPPVLAVARPEGRRPVMNSKLRRPGETVTRAPSRQTENALKSQKVGAKDFASLAEWRLQVRRRDRRGLFVF